MDIIEIAKMDEAQGFDLEQGRAWLQANGWTRDTTAPVSGWSKNRMWICDATAKDLLGEIQCIAHVEGISFQALLRAMNPRLRRGMPSVAAWEAHGQASGLWVAIWDITKEQAGNFSWFAQQPIVTRLRRYDTAWDWGIRGAGFHHDEAEGFPETQWLFWPVDKNGSRVRWPTNSDGALL